MTKALETMNLNLITCGQQKCIDDQSWGPGVRDYYILHYVLSGRGYLRFNNQTYPVKAGQSFLIYPNSPVYYYSDTSDPWEYIWVGFSGSDASLLLNKTNFTIKHPITNRIPVQNIQPIFSAVIQSEGLDDFLCYRTNGYLYVLLSYYIEYFPAENMEDNGFQYVQNALTYISANYHHILTIQEVADHLGISRTHLYRMFQTYMAMSPNDYLIRYRIQSACSLLCSTTLSIKEIAYSVGFNNQLYFSKAFRRVTGQTPSQHRASNKQDVARRAFAE